MTINADKNVSESESLISRLDTYILKNIDNEFFQEILDEFHKIPHGLTEPQLKYQLLLYLVRPYPVSRMTQYIPKRRRTKYSPRRRKPQYLPAKKLAQLLVRRARVKITHFSQSPNAKNVSYADIFKYLNHSNDDKEVSPANSENKKDNTSPEELLFNSIINPTPEAISDFIEEINVKPIARLNEDGDVVIER